MRSVWILMEYQWGREHPEQIVAVYDSYDKACAAEAEKRDAENLGRDYHTEEWTVE